MRPPRPLTAKGARARPTSKPVASTIASTSCRRPSRVSMPPWPDLRDRLGHQLDVLALEARPVVVGDQDALAAELEARAQLAAQLGVAAPAPAGAGATGPRRAREPLRVEEDHRPEELARARTSRSAWRAARAGSARSDAAPRRSGSACPASARPRPACAGRRRASPPAARCEGTTCTALAPVPITATLRPVRS